MGCGAGRKMRPEDKVARQRDTAMTEVFLFCDVVRRRFPEVSEGRAGG